MLQSQNGRTPKPKIGNLPTYLPLRQERIADVLRHKRDRRVSRLQGVIDLRLLPACLPGKFGLTEAIVCAFVASDPVIGDILLQDGLDVVTALSTKVWTSDVDCVFATVSQIFETTGGGVVGNLGLWSWCRQGIDCQKGSGGDCGETHIGFAC